MATTQRRTLKAALPFLLLIGCGGVGAVQTVPQETATEGDDERAASFAQALDAFLGHDAAGDWDAATCDASRDRFLAVSARTSTPPERAQALYMAGMSDQRCGDRARAAIDYRAALDAHAGHCGARVGLGLVDLAEDRPDRAESAFRAAIARDRQCTEGYVNLAKLERRRGALDDALGHLRRALAIEADHVVALDEMALVHLDRADEDVHALDIAELVCRQGFAVSPEHAPLHNTWGVVNAQQGRIVEALSRFERAFTLDPDFYEAYMNFGQITLSFRGYADAEHAFREALRVEPDDYDAHIGLGVALRGLGRMDEAEAQYVAARALDVDRPEAWFNLGILEQDHRGGTPDDLDDALAHFETFVSKAGGEAAYREQVDEVSRCCAAASRDCRPGRLQNIRAALRAQGRSASGC